MCILRKVVQIQNFKIILLMQAQLTEFLLKITFQRKDKASETATQPAPLEEESSWTSQQILSLIHSTINSEKNSKHSRNHKLSLWSDDTTPQSPIKCNCKKSKCLKLYCECFAKGSFCKGCNCDCCQNTEQFSEVRAKAIDQTMAKTMSFGYKSSSSTKGCSCKKTGCSKKYCQCFSQGVSCNQYCKCNNCENTSAS